MKQISLNPTQKEKKEKKLSLKEYLRLEKQFYETTTHLRKTFKEYIEEKVTLPSSPKEVKEVWKQCKTHIQVYAFIVRYMIDWDIPL